MTKGKGCHASRAQAVQLNPRVDRPLCL